MPGINDKLVEDLIAAHGEGQRVRIERGVRQAASLWQPEDGNAEAFAAFVRENFISDPALLDDTFQHFEYALEQINGHLSETARELRHWRDLDCGPLLPIDHLFAAFDPGAHLVDDLFHSKIAFIVLLNFPLTTLAERLEKGKTWTRKEWAQARLAQQLSKRIPAAVHQQITRAVSEGEAYVTQYNIWMHHVLDAEDKRLFPRDMRLISHWNLRDQLKADYSEPDGLPRQRVLAKVMERVVTQTIPRAVIDNPRVDWNPFANTVQPAPAGSIEPSAPPASGVALTVDPEPDTRYAHMLATFHAVRQADPFSPTAPTHIARVFDEHRELPEARVEQMLKEVLGSPLLPRVARLIEQRLQRKLEPFDIWYSGFRPRGKYSEADLTAIVSKKYPDLAAFQADMSRLIHDIGFTPERARYLSERIAVDPCRGAGHAMSALRRGDKPRLRTRAGNNGMDYKGYNIALHEMGHNVEQVLSLYEIDHTLLASVPNTAFTEAVAFLFQSRDLQLLGLEKPDPDSRRLRVLERFWSVCEIAGPALVDMGLWHWMYDHPAAAPSELREAVLHIARDIWNRYWAPVIGVRDVVLLGVYSHMINLMMYLPDYPLGLVIGFQIEEYIQGKNLDAELERMLTFGSVTPDLWMEHATGSAVSAEPLLRATEAVL